MVGLCDCSYCATNKACITDYGIDATGGQLCGHYSQVMEEGVLLDQELKNIEHRIILRRTVHRYNVLNRLSDFCELGYLFCCPPCLPSIIHKMAFSPPIPTYKLVPFGPAKNGEYRFRLRQDVKYLKKMSPRSQFAHYSPLLRCFCIPKIPGKKKRLACAYFRCPIGNASGKTILFSHASSVDLGLEFCDIITMGYRMRIDVVAYDYSGYGRSDGPCSEKALYEDIECVFEFMVEEMKIPETQIVAIGMSLGTVATIHLASKHSVGAVVLQGSFSSALRTLCPNRQSTSCFDRFVCIDKIGAISCPTLFVHGENDDLFSAGHALMLRDKCPGATAVEPLIIEDGGHCDFEDHAVYWNRLQSFIDSELEGPYRHTATFNPECCYVSTECEMMTSDCYGELCYDHDK